MDKKKKIKYSNIINSKINMSARNIQSDTSRVIVKNPLLSAVAGSIDDFVNNSILLPAAEIPVPVVPPPLLSHDTLDPTDNRGNLSIHSLSLFLSLLMCPIWMKFKVLHPNKLV